MKTIATAACILTLSLILTSVDLQETSEAESHCFISDLIPEISVGTSKRETMNETDLIPPCEPNTEDDSTCTIVLDNVAIIFDGNLTATIANYTPFPDFCINGSLSRECVFGIWVDDNIIREIATQTVLEVWHIVLIVIGISILVAGDVCLTIIATAFIARGKPCGICFGIVLMVIAWVTFPPIAIPLSIIILVVCVCCGSGGGQCGAHPCFLFISFLTGLVTVSSVVLWVSHASFSLENEFYGEGPLRDENGTCVEHEPNNSEKEIQKILTITSFVLSVIAGHLWPILLCCIGKMGKKWGKSERLM
jgi:hypothetical protein